ncbi:MAG: cation transporter [Nitrosomonas sp. PRO4]|nr:cation transporter [Nitrosomonas sp. PRO4]
MPDTHHHTPETHNRLFIIAVLLNTIYVIIEFAYGFIANSAALMADAGHNLSDVLALLLAWAAAMLARKEPSERFTYGLRSTSILAALGNAVFLLIICGGIAWEAMQRLSDPPVVAELTVTLVATAGIFINGLSAWLFIKGSQADINIRGAYLHMMADAAVSLGVVISGIGMMVSGWYWLDPVISLVIVIVIVMATWGLLRESVHLALNAVPPGIDALAIETYLRNHPGVTDIHDLHIWGMSTTESALTVHLVMPDGYPGDTFMDDMMETLNSRFNIHHCTLQVEMGTTNHACVLQARKTVENSH